ncbi:MAG: GNAT family N-acetyltransferase, partial [Anaerolineales bacterium]
MSIGEQLFEGERIRLSPHDPDKDAETESRWTHDPAYLRLLSLDPARPLSPGQIKKKYEEAEKDKSHNRFSFAIRAREDDRLIGFARLERIEWNNGAGWLALGIGAPEDRRKGYGTEALRLLLRYAFDELNLHRLSAATPEYNTGALRLLEKTGFRAEIRRRQAFNRAGRRWDDIWFGILREEWERP